MHVPEATALPSKNGRRNGAGLGASVEGIALEFGSRLLAIERCEGTGGADAGVSEFSSVTVVLEYDYESGLAYPRWTVANHDEVPGNWELRLSKVFDCVHASLVYQQGPVVWFTPRWRQAAVNTLRPVSPPGLIHLISSLVLKPV